ncbi:hypothetical protein [uncultured Olleya sp.]|nr:hypothetical protein [uncultured Olleya sp.]
MKNLKNLGQALSKAEQKTINGGYVPKMNPCDSSEPCPAWQYCQNGYCNS